MITKFFMFILFVGIVNVSYTEKASRTLDVVWEIEGRNILLEYTNQGSDTIYVADLSLSRNEEPVIPNTSTGDINMNFYLMSNNAGKAIDLEDRVKIFLGASVIPPKAKHVVTYRSNGNTLNKLTVEYSTTSPELPPYSFKKLVINFHDVQPR